MNPFLLLLLQPGLPDKTPEVIANYKETLFQLDEVLKTDLAASLAGLSLAALALLLSSTFSLKSRTQSLEHELKNAQSPNYRDAIQEEIDLNLERQHAINKATKDLYWAFTWFMFFLLESLSLDVMAEKDIALMNIPYALPADLMIAGGFMLAGIIALWSGAKKISLLL